MYYLTYRPKTIAELDNENPRETIQKVLASKNLPHAFLFTGQKGTGKTSTARIVAKALNCLNNKQSPGEPCNQCIHCKGIDSSSFPDVWELDAASNRGINEVKNLIRESNFMPLSGTWRVFIIDEAHMITNDGFNALLKTLEEPPTSVMFILATTNKEKVPKTIQSRCFPVEFGRAKEEEIIHMLVRIAKNEKLTVQPDLLKLIAEHSDESFRDAAKLLEELVMLKFLDVDRARTHIGLRSKNSFLELLGSKTEGDAIAWIQTFQASGGGFKTLTEELLRQLQTELLKVVGINKEPLLTKLTKSQIILLMKLFQEAYIQLRSSPVEAIPLEIAVVEFYNKKS